jgi:DNA-binding CsgD family transcriptional regulator
MGTGRSAERLLLERAAELDVIATAIGAARAGTGSALLIEGAAGIGKTRLLAYACEHAAAAGMTVLTARAAEYEDGYAWGVVRQLFEPELRSASPGDDLVSLAAQALVRPSAPRDEDSFAVLHGLYWVTADIAHRAPLLLAVDDLHWADPPSQRFVAHLARRLEGLPVLLAVTIREPRAGTAQAKALISGLAAEPAAVTVRPTALSAEGCALLVAAALGAAPSAAFRDACHELTGGNPLLIGGLLTTLAAEGVRGTDADVPHLRRLTPDTVSRHVLLRLGRLSPIVLAAARAIAVLGTSATTARAARLADLDRAACADAVGVLMAEQFVEGELHLRFVHPLVRSAVYQDIAPPVRQQWHKRAARLLAAESAASAEVTVHLLGSAAEADPWVAGQLRQAASDARGRGAPDVAAQCLERALAEPPPAQARADLLYELGTAQTFRAPAAAVDHLTAALEATSGWPQRGQVALALSEALALCGRFSDAVKIVQEALREADDQDGEANRGAGRGPIVDSLQAVLLNIARWDLSTRAVGQSLLVQLSARAEAGAELHPQLHANLAIELCVAGSDRQRALRHAREAVRATSELMSLTSTALPEAVTVLLFADAVDEAWAAARKWLRLAQERGQPLAAAIAASVASVISHYDGDIRSAVAYGQQAVANGSTWISVISTALVVPAMIDFGDRAGARALLAEQSLLADLLPIWPFNMARFARGCLHAADGDHKAAAEDLQAAGELAVRWGIHNPSTMPWRSAAALSRNALGDHNCARRLAAEEVELARRWGSARAIGTSLRAAGLVEGGARGVELLTESVSVLRRSSARLELARALLDLGAAHRRAGARGTARDLLRESLDLAHALGGRAVAERAREELVAAGGRPRRDATHGRDALTPSELRVAELAAAGRTNRQIAQALFVTQRTVENHLTSTYAKLGISARPELAAAITDSALAASAARRTAPTSR